MQFNIDSMSEIRKLATIVRRSGYFNPDESVDSVAEKVAFILVTKNLLERCETRRLLVKALVNDLNEDKQFRETLAQEANRSNYQKQKDIARRGGSQELLDQPDLRFVNIEAGTFTDDEGNPCNYLEPACEKTAEQMMFQQIYERRKWTYENLEAFFKYILKKDPDEAGISKDVRRRRVMLFNKVFESTWNADGDRLKMYKIQRGKVVLDEASPYFNLDASFVTEYIKRLNQNITNSDHWRSFLLRYAEDHEYKATDWEYPMWSAYKEALETLNEEDRKYILSWLDYETKPSDYTQLKLCYEIFNRVYECGGEMLHADSRKHVMSPEWFEIEIMED